MHNAQVHEWGGGVSQRDRISNELVTVSATVAESGNSRIVGIGKVCNGLRRISSVPSRGLQVKGKRSRDRPKLPVIRWWRQIWPYAISYR